MECAASQPISPLDPDTSAWLDELAATGYRRDSALERLHAVLVRAGRREAARRAAASPVSGVELADIAQQAADDALVAIVNKLDDFRGESRFTTWAYKFVVLEVASKLTRHAWRTKPTVSEGEDWEKLPDRFGLTPQETLEQRELLGDIRDAVQTMLTERQRIVFVALVLNGVPLDVLTAELGSNRNALYKVLFDARRKVRAHLVANGYTEYE
jgi:RNA polymerase sigma-70 factor, ECF subfamily